MRKELIDRILQVLISEDCFRPEIEQELEIILSDYEIGKRKTEVAIVREDENQMMVRKFITAKIVKGLSERTLKYYKETITEFLRRVQKNISEITADDIRLFLAIRRKKDGVSDITAGNELRNLRAFFNWLYMEELIKKNPVAKVETIKCAKQKKKAFTEYEIELIRGQCRTTLERAIIEILLSTGCRVKELATMKRSDIEGESLIVHGKGNKDRTVYLNAKAQIALSEYLEDRKDNSDWLFPKGVPACEKSGNIVNKKGKDWYKYKSAVVDEPRDISSIEATVRKIGRRAGVEKTHPHRFRRTCATLALRRGMPVEQVSKMLGHAGLNTTMIYLDLSEEELEQAHKKYVI